METKPNDSAYPQTFDRETLEEISEAYYKQKQEHLQVAGLSKREYFAAMAMQGMISMSNKEDFMANDIIEAMCSLSVHTADALIEQLNQTK